jgi:hypothetical protein
MPYGTAVQVIMNLRERVEDFYKEIPKIRKSLRTRRKPQPEASARRELREREMGGCGDVPKERRVGGSAGIRACHSYSLYSGRFTHRMGDA